MENITICRKIKLFPVGDKEEINRVYTYLRDGMYSQNKAYNILISNIYSAIYRNESNETINETYKKGKRNPKENDQFYSLYEFGEITFPKGLPTASSVGQRVKKDIKTAQKDGLFKGKISLPNKKLDAPLMIESQQFSFYYDYENYNDFIKDLYTEKVNVYMKFVNGIVFKVIFGQPHKSQEVRSVFQKIFEEIYRVQQSSIQIDGKEIILNLSLSIPKLKPELDENVVVGVDLGIAVPAMCALNNNKYKRESIGDKDDLFNRRKKLQEQRSRLQTSLKMSKGGHGRQRKLKALERLRSNERNYVKTYNHMVSKRVVDFALKNSAKYINVEDLSGFKGKGKNDIVLRNWSYYELQQQITYKAEMNGIIVRKINPAYTSQKCSCCGYTDAGNRPKDKKGQAYFKCLECGEKMNADFNAARNIAMSTEFMN